MNKLEIDYSDVAPQVADAPEQDEWEPPQHKYFGRKLPGGKTEKEPVYVHQEYPRLMYSMADGKIKAKLVNSDRERDALGEGWEKNPIAFGYIGAPSYEEHVALQAAKAAEPEPAKRGRPAKAE